MINKYIRPYEGRYGSGGINTMLAVGIASLNEIRRSHSRGYRRMVVVPRSKG
ncbi:hypothetical protein [Halothece sp. PCC 7418]|uniref:hypothetical protein n=1 Tax=Halothece sp. (strain PCC 7418) TaxID=65093 RepID=UPI0002DCE6F5|nr:hypothetical protein [Halothece sp. PCC 7418]